MKVFNTFPLEENSNSYLIGPEEPGDALIIDPIKLTTELLSLIEEHGYYIRSILVTHSHTRHIKGLKTFLRVYDAQVYAAAARLFDFFCKSIQDGDTLNLSDFHVEVIGVPGHSPDSLVYRICNMLFTGDSLSAGMSGSTSNLYAKSLLNTNIIEKIMSYPDTYIIFPGHGPPSTLLAERSFNLDLH